MANDSDTLEKTDKAFVEPIDEEPQMPGHERKLDPLPDWEPRYPGSGRLKGKVAHRHRRRQRHRPGDRRAVRARRRQGRDRLSRKPTTRT